MKLISRKKRLIAAGLAAVAAVLVAFAPFDGDPEPEVAEVVRILPVSVTPARQLDGYSVRRSFVGQVEARRRADIGFELGGAVVLLAVDEGDRIETGRTLARLDTKRLRARRAELEAQRLEAEARLALMASTRDRTRQALELDAISAQRWDEADRGFAAQEAVVRRVDAQIESIDVDLDKARLRAPFTGVVAKRFIDEGAVVAPGEPLIRLLETSRPDVRVGISASLAASVAAGDERAVVVRGRELIATVRALLPSRNPQTRTVDVVLTLPADASDLRDGDLADVAFTETVAARGFWLPRSALTESSRGLWAVFVAVSLPGENRHILERRELELLHVDGERVFARGTLTDGELVVSDGLQRLVPSQRVAVSMERER